MFHSGSSLPSSAQDQRSFIRVQPSTLTVGATYTWSCFVSRGRVNNSVSFSVTVASSPLIATIAGGVKRQIFANYALLLDGAKSTDPDVGSNSALSFEWNIFDEVGDTATSPSGASLTLPSTSSLALPGQSLNPGLYSVYLTVTDDNTGRSESAQALLEIVSSPIPKVTILGAPSRINPTSAVSAMASTVIVQSDGSEIPGWKMTCSYSWTMQGQSTNGHFVPIGSGQTICIGGATCRPFVFSSGDLVRFTATVSCEGISAAATAYFDTAVNSPPSTGSLLLSASNVTSDTPVTLTAANWLDDITLQLRYTFGFFKQLPTTGTFERVIVSSLSTPPTASVICPAGRCVGFVQIFDDEGAYTEVTGSVMSLPTIVTLQNIIERIANATCDIIMNMVTTVTSNDTLVTIQLNKAFSACQTFVNPSVMLDSTLGMPVSPTLTVSESKEILSNAVNIVNELNPDVRYKLFLMGDQYATSSSITNQRRLLAIHSNPDTSFFDRFSNGVAVIKAQSSSLILPDQYNFFPAYANTSSTTRRFIARTNPTSYTFDVAAMFSSSPSYSFTINIPTAFYQQNRADDAMPWGIAEINNEFTESIANTPDLVAPVSPVVQFGVMNPDFTLITGAPSSPVMIDFPLSESTCTSLPCNIECRQFVNSTQSWNTTSTVVTVNQTQLTQVSCAVSSPTGFVAVYRTVSISSSAPLSVKSSTSKALNQTTRVSPATAPPASVLEGPTPAPISSQYMKTTHAPVQALAVTLRLILNFTEVNSDFTSFATSFANSISTAIGIPASRIQVISISEGSVIVKFAILPDATSSVSPSDVLQQITNQLQDPSSALRSDTSLNVDSNFTPISETVIDCGDGIWKSSCTGSTPAPTTAYTAKGTAQRLSAGAIAGIVISAVAFIGIVIILLRRMRRRRHARKLIEEPPAQMAPNPILYVQQSPGIQPVISQPVGVQGMFVGSQPAFPAMQSNPVLAYPVLQPNVSVGIPVGQSPAGLYVAQQVPAPNQKPNQ